MIRRLPSRLLFVLILGCLATDALLAGDPRSAELILLTTTTTRDSGILEPLIKSFTESSGYRVKAIVAGSADVLKQGGRGEGDVVLSHSPEAERQWMAEGNGTSRRLVMYNDFILIGPAEDPARIAGQMAAEALKRIAAAQALFVSRGDASGTHVRELTLWRAAALNPKGRPWYHETGQGQGLTMDVASQKGAYALTDRGTFLVHQQRLKLKLLVENDPGLLNIYHIMPVNPAKFPRVNAAAGQAFADFMVSASGQRIIAEFGKERFGRSLFTPAAGMTESEILPPRASVEAAKPQSWSYWDDLRDGAAGALQLLFSGDPETWSVIRQSLLISLSATALSLLIGLPIGTWLAQARFRGRSIILALCNTGFGLPPVVVGLVLSILLLRHGPLGWLHLRFTPFAMVIAQFILSLPIVIGLTVAAIQQLPPRLRLQMLVLGASPWQLQWLLWREIRLPLLAAYMAAFGSIISEVGASMMVGGNLPGTTRVLTTAIVMETGMGHYDRALAYGLILLLMVLTIVGLLTWLQQREART